MRTFWGFSVKFPVNGPYIADFEYRLWVFWTTFCLFCQAPGQSWNAQFSVGKMCDLIAMPTGRLTDNLSAREEDTIKPNKREPAPLWIYKVWCIINMNGVESHRYHLVQNQRKNKKQNKNTSQNVSQICEGLSSGKDPTNHLELKRWASSWVYISWFLCARCSITSENDDGT